MESDIKCVCFTGHRTIDNGIVENIERQIEGLVKELYFKGTKKFISGGANGFDILAAKAVLRIREKYADIELELVLPCSSSFKRKNQKEQEDFDYVYMAADTVTVLSLKYYNGCMHKRNRYMVDKSDYCIAYLKKENGGTFYTVNYAMKKGIKVKNIAE